MTRPRAAGQRVERQRAVSDQRGNGKRRGGLGDRGDAHPGVGPVAEVPHCIARLPPPGQEHLRVRLVVAPGNLCGKIGATALRAGEFPKLAQKIGGKG